MMQLGEIHLTPHPYALLESMQIPTHQLKIFEAQDLKIAQTKEIIAEAYIANSALKHIVIIAQAFNLEAQNALLKVLEEPPPNTKFYIFTQNKNALIPTVRSRLILHNHQKAPALEVLEIDLKHLSFQAIYDCLKGAEKIQARNEAQHFIERLLHTIHAQGISLNQQELDKFDQAIKAILRYERLHFVLLPLLLCLKGKR